ncbi:MAG: hypothetical protein SPL15_08120 [Lachnospiraceae bacterium]|nr:hypothetical protein [Lachnospiraceae bacterium]MDY5742940.1 hypothetical protein [Lachnospiraceae bacterium]
MKRVWKRGTAWMLVWLLIWNCTGWMTAGSLAAPQAHQGKIILVVKDHEGVVRNATVVYQIDSIADGSTKVAQTTKQSGNDGVVELMAHSDFVDNDLKLTARITKTGYEKQMIDGKVLTLTEQPIEVQLLKSLNDVQVTAYEGSFDQAEHELVTIMNTNPSDKVLYTIDGNQTESVPKRRDVGIYTVMVEIERKGHQKLTKEVTAKIHKAQVTGLELHGVSVVEDGQEHPAAELVGAVDDYHLRFELDGTAKTELPKIKDYKAGGYQVKVIAEPKTDATNYEPLTMTVQSFVQKKQNLEFNNEQVKAKANTVFEKNLAVDAAQNRYDFSASGNNLSGRDIEYSIVKATDPNVAQIDAQTGLVTLQKAGVMTVRAYRPGNDEFTEAEVLQTVVVKPTAQLTISFIDRQKVYILNIDGTADVQEAVKSEASGGIRYLLGEEALQAGLSIDEATGEVRVADRAKLFEQMKESAQFSVPVTAKLTGGLLQAEVWKADEKAYSSQPISVFDEAEATYELVIRYASATDGAFSVSDPADTGWYNVDHKAVITVKDHTAYEMALDTPADPAAFGDRHEITAEGTTGHYVYLKNKSTGQISHGIYVPMKVDYTKPVALSPNGITYQEYINNKDHYLYFNPAIRVNFRTEDLNADGTAGSGVETVSWMYQREGGVSEKFLPQASGILRADAGNLSMLLTAAEAKQYRGNLSYTMTDKAGNVGDRYEEAQLIIGDTTAPVLRASYSTPEAVDGEVSYYQEQADVTLVIEELNFFEEDVYIYLEKADGSKQAVPASEITWTKLADDRHQAVFSIRGDGEYHVLVSYADRSLNEMSPYRSQPLVLDSKKPEVKATFDQTTQSTTFTVIEQNFKAADIRVDLSAKDAAGQSVTPNDLQSLLQNATWERNGEVNTFTTDAFVDGIYRLRLQYSDPIGQTAETELTFMIDHTAPQDVGITYPTPVGSYQENGKTVYYYRDTVELVFSAVDKNAGVKQFVWSYIKEDGASAVNTDQYTEVSVAAIQDSTDPTKYTGRVQIPREEADQLRGHISLRAEDDYQNRSAQLMDSQHVTVYDTVAPTLEAVFDEPTMGSGQKHFYQNDRVKAALTFTEANFHTEDVILTLEKNGIAQTVQANAWIHEKDRHTATIIVQGEGHYVLRASYHDRSANRMPAYTSEEFVIDNTAPTVTIVYANTAVQNILQDASGNSRKYFKDEQVAEVTVHEEHFDEAGVYWQISAADVSGNALAVDGLVTIDQWKHQGDTHTTTVRFYGEANYDFDMTMTDRAMNVGKDIPTAHFTVDKTAPGVTAISYSDAVANVMWGGLPYGFYRDQVTVTVTARDTISGVHGFDTESIRAAGVSAVNEATVYTALQEANITYSADRSIATIQFVVPRSVIEGAQFNGTVTAVVRDRSMNQERREEGQRLVVDSISPTATVTYNPAVQTVGDTAYYAGSIIGTITVGEANFDGKDVHVTATLNGHSFNVETNWSSVNSDTHIGTFTLQEDGEYQISIQYSDKSSNAMQTYSSQRMKIDTGLEDPVFIVNNEEKKDGIGGAHREDVVISYRLSDENFESGSLKLVRTGFKQVEDVTQRYIQYTARETGIEGQFEIPRKVENEGIYTLTATVRDKAGHEKEKQLKFTINRFGSVYEYDDYLLELIKDGGRYLKKDGDRAVQKDLMITEYNADRLTKDSLKINITRDGETIEAKYSSNPQLIDEKASIGTSGWYQYIYMISRDNFTEDGVYKITLTSKDDTGNTTTNVPENSMSETGEKVLDEIIFTVDTTAPQIRNITGLDREIINAAEVEVEYSIADIGGLANISIYVDDEKITEVTDFSDLHYHQGSFRVKENHAARNVRLVAIDKAGNVTDTAEKDWEEALKESGLFAFIGHVTISTNLFVRWYANKLLFGSSIAVAAALLGSGIFFLLWKRRKREEH